MQAAVAQRYSQYFVTTKS